MKGAKRFLRLSLPALILLLSGSALTQTGWVKYAGNPVLGLGNFGEFDYRQAKQPSVLFDSGIFKTWYVGRDTAQEQIGYAESEDGIH